MSRILPARWLGRKSPAGVNTALIGPPTGSMMPGIEPLQGTRSRSVFWLEPSSAPRKCGVEPAAGEP